MVIFIPSSLDTIILFLNLLILLILEIKFFYLSTPGFCGICHDVNLVNGFRLEEAFSEYKHSPSAADRSAQPAVLLAVPAAGGSGGVTTFEVERVGLSHERRELKFELHPCRSHVSLDEIVEARRPRQIILEITAETAVFDDP